MFVSVRLRTLLLVVFCFTAAFADSHLGRSASAPARIEQARADSKLVTQNKSAESSVLQGATPGLMDGSKDALSATHFNSLAMTAGDFSAKWSDLQNRIRADELAVAACLSDQTACTQAARRLLTIGNLGRKHEGRIRLGWINRAVNLAIRPMSDWVHYGYADFWASPLQTLSSGTGDCEDYAIVKYVVLRELGVPSNNLKLVIVHDDRRDLSHAIVAVRSEQHWLILDNRTMAILDAEDAHHYRPLFALDQQRVSITSTAAIDQITDR
jgi:predicted transglutaminase-like cysteine proteinase